MNQICIVDYDVGGVCVTCASLTNISDILMNRVYF